MKLKSCLPLAIACITLPLGAANHKTRQNRPIQLGTSGGSVTDIVGNGCCSGTLGSLVQDADGTLYILSNTHVFAGDTNPGGNHRVSAPGDPINQPGNIDIGCKNKSSDYVAHLSRWVAIKENGTTSVDAAIAKVAKDAVDTTGAILEIGTISSTPVDAFVGQKVKKSGRTSGLTRGKITSLNATIQVEYSDECGGSDYLSTFKNQIIIQPGSFLKGGDSGSLMVEDVATNPRPIGLLFAGSDDVAIANPIKDVLNALNITMCGTPSTTAQTATINLTIAKSVQEAHADTLLAIDGVVGHAIGLSAQGRPVIHALVTSLKDMDTSTIPKKLGGLPVQIIQIGKLRAF